MNLTTLLDSLKIHNSMYEGIRTPLIHAVSCFGIIYFRLLNWESIKRYPLELVLLNLSTMERTLASSSTCS